MEENKQLQLLDVLGIPFASNKNINNNSVNNNNHENIIFSQKEKSLIFSLGSNIIHYNLKKDCKTFLQYFSSNISVLKFISELENILLVITSSSFPLVSIWQTPSFQCIYSQELTTQDDFQVGQIFFEKINPITYLILITSQNNNINNFLYTLNLSKNGNFDISFIGKLKYIITKICGFGSFYNSNNIAFLMNYNLQYYSIDFKVGKCIMKKNINFSFKLKENTLKISKINNMLCVITEKGNCLIYDQNGENRTTINPLGQECFTSCEFCDDSLCFGTSHGNVYVYNIYGFNLRYMISYNDIAIIKNMSLINVNNNMTQNNKYIKDNEIMLVSLNEIFDQIFIIFKDNIFVFMSIKKLVNNTKFVYSLNLTKTNTISFYSFNQSNKILDLCMNLYEDNFINKNIRNEANFYSCSLDNKLIKYYIDQNSDKLKNQYFDLNHLISTSKQNNQTKNYFTVLKLHPLFTHKLFAGDNKGFLYIINLSADNKFRKYNIGTFEIVLINFSESGNLLCIGFETGYKLIYKTNKIFQCVLKLNEHYLNIDDIEYRKMNNHILTYCTFLNSNKNRHCILYTKEHNIIEFAKLFKSDNGLSLYKKKIMSFKIKNSILDIVLHKSENYIIVLNDRKQIIINNILENKTTAIIDLSSQMKKIYNIQIDISGLFLAVICDTKKWDNKHNSSTNKNDLIIIEISTSKVKNYIIQTSPISKVIFDNVGKYLIVGGELGEVSLWRLPGEISSTIKNFLSDVKNDINFWEKYEIRYNNHWNDNDYSLFSMNEKDKNNEYKNDNLKSISSVSEIEERENKIAEEIINNNIYNDHNNNYRTVYNNKRIKNNNKYRSLKEIKIPNSMKKTFKMKKYLINENDNIYNDINGIENIRYNNYNKNGLNNLRNKSHNYLNRNDRYKTNYLEENNNRYNFWTNKDTINIKRSLNANRNNKYPEPLDIDDYLNKRNYK